MAGHAANCVCKNKTAVEIGPGVTGHNWTTMITRLSIITLLLACCGCVTAPNSNQSITINLLGSLSRFGHALGGTNTTIKGQIEGGGSLTATVPMTP